MARQIFRHPSGLGPNHQDPVSAPPPGLRDPDRLAALYRTALLDSPPDAAFDRLTALATRLTGAPITLGILDTGFMVGGAAAPTAVRGPRGTGA